MNRKQKEMANSLLQAASERLGSFSGDAAAYNLLSVLQVEHFETKTHSKIIRYLLTDNAFLHVFLRVLRIPEKFLDGTWSVHPEQTSYSGADRMDFVLESNSCCAIIEMKIGAGDGDRQLVRYEAFGRKKGKEYFLYYLTLDGHAPEEQSAGGIAADRLRCISFRKEICAWLQACMKCVEADGYKYSFLKQYLGAVRHVTDSDDGGIDVKDLLDSSEMAKAAQLVANSFYEKMDDITDRFFQKLDVCIRRKTKLETCLFTNALDIYLKEFTYRRHSYCVKLFVELDTYLVAGMAFSEVLEEDVVTLRLENAEKIFPSIYKKWMEKLDSLENIPKFKRWPRSRYFSLEDSRGSQLNFRDHSAQILLLDEMDEQCKYICSYIVNRMIKPLLDD